MKTSFYEIFFRCSSSPLVDEANREDDDCDAQKVEACLHHRREGDVSIVAYIRNQTERIVGDVDDDARNQTPGSETHPRHGYSQNDGSWNLCRIEVKEVKHDP